MGSSLYDFVPPAPASPGGAPDDVALRLAGSPSSPGGEGSPRVSPADASVPQSGGFDVKASDLFRVSGSVAGGQEAMHGGVSPFLQKLTENSEAGGGGIAAEEFARTYAQVADRFLDVYAKSVVSLGGAAVGFTVTANNYLKADAASDPSNNGGAATRPEPNVIRKVQSYGPVTPLSWNDSGEDGFISSVLDGIDTGFWAVFQELLQYQCRWGEAAEVMPLPNYIDLAEISVAWQMPMTTLGRAESALITSVGSITDQSNSEWYSAMRTFCSSLWGTTYWGQDRVGYQWEHDRASSGTRGATEPIFAVLLDTASGIKLAVDAYAQDAEQLRDELRRIFYEAVREALPRVRDGIGVDDFKKLGKTLFKGAVNLATGTTLEIDTAAMEAAVRKYSKRVNEQTQALKDLVPALDEAYLSAPTFHAETARAQAFGARSLHEFKEERHYAVPGEDKENHFFPVDLASQEGIHGSHVIDKHVGMTDDQLAQRLRDQPKIDAASSFPSLEVAQEATQDAIDHIGPSDTDPSTVGEANRGVNNPAMIEKWLSRPRNDNSLLVLQSVKLDYETGSTVSAQQSDAGSARDTHSVQVVLQYKNGLEPPFVVLTSMPTLP